MTTSHTHRVLRPVALAALLLAAAGAASVGRVDAAGRDLLEEKSTRIGVTRLSAPSTPTRRAPRAAYGWPVKPFDRQHPVRGFFGDPRISNHGRSRQFHFGIDISAPNGAPVYATISGAIYIHPLHATTVAIVDRDGVEFSYWHVVPTVRTGQRAVAYETVIGHIEEPYAHVHFSERRGGRYLNPLRPGALGPFADATEPWVTTVRVEDHGDRVLVAEAYDETPLAVARPWHDLPVTPALVRWRLLDATGRTLLGWRTAADFRETIPNASAFQEVWAPGTTQNHVRAPGRYRIVLARNLELGGGRSYLAEVVARDTRGNTVRVRLPLDSNVS